MAIAPTFMQPMLLSLDKPGIPNLHLYCSVYVYVSSLWRVHRFPFGYIWLKSACNVGPKTAASCLVHLPVKITADGDSDAVALDFQLLVKYTSLM